MRDLRAADVPAEPVSLGVAVQDAAGCPGAVSQGACVIAIRPNSAANRAGLAVGDVIQSLGQTPVADAAALIAAVRRLTVGQDVEITYLRAGKPQHRSLQLIPGDRASDWSAGPPIQAPIQTLIVQHDP
jgi:S1-C subfamily serine protease